MISDMSNPTPTPYATQTKRQLVDEIDRRSGLTLKIRNWFMSMTKTQIIEYLESNDRLRAGDFG